MKNTVALLCFKHWQDFFWKRQWLIFFSFLGEQVKLLTTGVVKTQNLIFGVTLGWNLSMTFTFCLCFQLLHSSHFDLSALPVPFWLLMLHPLLFMASFFFLFSFFLLRSLVSLSFCSARPVSHSSSFHYLVGFFLLFCHLGCSSIVLVCSPFKGFFFCF